jgi:hypothetical protein
MNIDLLRDQIREDLMRDSTEYCCYCGEVKRWIGCCGENHFETYADMRFEDQQVILNEMVEDEIKLLNKEKK